MALDIRLEKTDLCVGDRDTHHMARATGNNKSIFTNTKCQIVTNGYSRDAIADCSANALYALYGLHTGSVSWEILHDIPFGEPEFRNVSLWAWLGWGP